MQKFDTRGNPDEDSSLVTSPLLHTSTSVSATADTTVSTTADSVGPSLASLDEAKAKENSWVKHSLTLVEKEELTRDDTIAWSACHALLQAPSEDPPASNSSEILSRMFLRIVLYQFMILSRRILLLSSKDLSLR